MRKKMMGGGMMMQRPMYKKGGSIKKPKIKKIDSTLIRKNKEVKEFIRKDEKYNKDKIGYKDGGSLKSVPAGNKGLKKLPTEVRNKMGFMKKGGVVSDTKKKQFKANQAGSIKMAKKVLTDNLAGDIYKDKRVRKFASKVKEGLKNSPLNLKGAAEGYINLGKKITRKFKGDK